MRQIRLLALGSALSLLALNLACGETESRSEPPKPTEPPLVSLPSSGPVTPEMWFYTQEYQRYQQPKEAVRRKAELRAAQRQSRLEAQRWFGFSKLRPVANPIPFYGSYSPAWVGSAWDPYAWRGYGAPYVTFHGAGRRR